MKKKVISLLLSATMVASLLVGCGNEEVANTTTDEGAATTDEAAPAEVQQADASAVDNLIANTEGTVELTVWASELQQDFTQDIIDEFVAAYPDIDFDIKLGAQSEAECKDTVLTDVEAAADVYTFADDQINDLVAAGALQAVTTSYTYDVANETLGGALEAATVDGTLYAYPSTASNGYFMFYSKEYFTEDDVQTLDGMLKVAEENGKKVSMDVSNGWYIYSFFKGAGLDSGLNEDGSNYCDWAGEGGTDVVQAILDIAANPGFQQAKDEEFQTGIAEGTIIAGVSGTWDAEKAQEAWGENYAAVKLPTYTVAGEQVQMSSYSGYKLIGVNPHSKNVGWAMLLAEYLTNESTQVARFEATSEGPANLSASQDSAVLANPAIAALASQAAYATPQRIGGNYWAPAETLGGILTSGNPDGTDLQELLDTTVEGITAPVEE